MGILSVRSAPERIRRHDSDEREFRVLVALTFPIFLAIVLIGAVIGKRPSDDGNAQRKSILSQAMVAASTTIAIAFMG